MQIDTDGTLMLSAEENQDLMDQLKIPESEYDDPPVELVYMGDEAGLIILKAKNTKTGKEVLLEYELLDEA